MKYGQDKDIVERNIKMKYLKPELW
jgi:hypothetical protein